MSPRLGRYIMGCVGSRQDEHSKKRREDDSEAYGQSNCKNNASRKGGESGIQASSNDGGPPEHMQPKISMMSDHTLKLLKEIGELKSFTEIDPSEINLNKYSDFIMALENPQAATNNVKTRST